MNTQHCRGCGATIMFVGTTTPGKSMPIDPDPVDDGNIRLDTSGHFTVAHVLGPLELELARGEGEALHKSHFAVCPNADRFRR